MNIFQKITNKKDDLMLFEEGILLENGRLSNEGQKLVVDLLFKGNSIDEVRALIIKEIKDERKNKNV